jgi:hypothetical protein
LEGVEALLAIHIDSALIEKFGRFMRDNLNTGSTAFRKPICNPSSMFFEADDAQMSINGSKGV